MSFKQEFSSIKWKIMWDILCQGMKKWSDILKKNETFDIFKVFSSFLSTLRENGNSLYAVRIVPLSVSVLFAHLMLQISLRLPLRQTIVKYQVSFWLTSLCFIPQSIWLAYKNRNLLLGDQIFAPWRFQERKENIRDGGRERESELLEPSWLYEMLIERVPISLTMSCVYCYWKSHKISTWACAAQLYDSYLFRILWLSAWVHRRIHCNALCVPKKMLFNHTILMSL